MKRFKIFVEIEKEKKYLVEMALKGLIMKKYSYFGFYTFEKEEPKDLDFKIDYRVFKKKAEFEEYKVLFEDAGWKHISGTYYGGFQYFLPNSKEMESTDIFSDSVSRAGVYKRLLNQSCLGFAMMIIYIAAVFTTNKFSLESFGYLTPGIWEKSGAELWRAIMFETPFVLLRGLPLLVLMLITITSVFWTLKAQVLYKKSLKENSECSN